MSSEQFTEVMSAALWLNPPGDAPWRWDEEGEGIGEAIVWSDGATIVFREELAQIIQALPPSGLPKPGAFILLLAACRGKVPLFSKLPAHLQPVVEGLHRIAALQSDLTRGTSNRALLVNHLLGDSPKRSTATASAVLNLLRGGQPLSAIIEKDTHSSFVEDVTLLLRPLAGLDTAALEMLLRTGIPEAPSAAAGLEALSAAQIGSFIDQLLADPDLAGIAKVARQIMAAISLPEALSRKDEDALGGFSDIGNRGPLHRLLLSELAHDDDTLSARIALNEALYLRREPAADHPITRLVVLIDSGLRMWGLPRLFATATALAFLAKGGKYRKPEVFRAVGGKPVTSTLWTKAGITEHLETLDTALDPSQAIENLAASIQHDANANFELIVITHRITLNDPAFARFLRTMGAGDPADIYAAGVDRDGCISFQTVGPYGVKPLKEAQINLADLFSTRITKSKPGTLRDASAILPAIFNENPFPFLLSVDLPVDLGWKTKDGGGICLTEHGNLWHWSHRRRGAVQLAAAPMHGKTVGLIRDETGGNWYAIKHRTNESRIDIVHWRMPEEESAPDRLRFHSIDAYSQPPLHAFHRGGYVYLVWPDRVIVISAETLEVVGRGDLPPRTKPIGGRFLFYETPGNTLSFGVFFWTGNRLNVAIDKIRKSADGYVPSKPLHMFDRVGHESPWMVSSSGRIHSVADPSKEHLVRSGTIFDAQASPNGNEVWLRYGDYNMLANLENKQISMCSRNSRPDHVFGTHASPPRWSVRSKFTHIALCPSGKIALRSQKGYWIKIGLREGSFKMERDLSNLDPAGTPMAGGLMHCQAFGREVPESKPRFDLRVAEWPDKSRAFLDQRGLLHLQSRDIAIPEVSFVLAESQSLPVWSSDGRKIGPAYFIGDHAPEAGDANAMEIHIREFVGAILS